MKNRTEVAIREGLRSAAASLPSNLHSGLNENRWFFSRNQAGGWQGSLGTKPNIGSIIALNYKPDENTVTELRQALEAEYPEYLQHVWIGNSGGPVDPTRLLHVLLGRCLEKFGTCKPTSDQIEQILGEVAEFFDSNATRFRLLAPIVGLHGPHDFPSIRLSEKVSLRALSDQECSDLYGSLYPMASSHPMFGVNYALVQDVAWPKFFGGFDVELSGKSYSQAQRAFERAFFALTSFKEFNPIGLDGIHVFPLTMCLNALAGMQRWSTDAVPFSISQITLGELNQLESHASYFENIPKELEIACHRLADANRRSKPQEAIIDAVIGLESILLFQIEQELSFRFSLNYSTLPFVDDRKKEFRFAKALYRLRSKIAHGTAIDADDVFSDEKLNLHEMAKQARSALRKTLCYFIKSPNPVVFATKDYWENLQLNLPNK